MIIKRLIKKNRILYKLSVFIVNFFYDMGIKRRTNFLIRSSCKEKTVFYVGVPMHANLGDQAQYVCIMKWLKENYPSMRIVQISNRSIAGGTFSSIKCLKKYYKNGDIIVFQSGYATTDLSTGDLVHKKVINALPDAKILMMPQTVFYKDEARRISASEEYCKANNMLFLARDKTSYQIALDIFNNIDIILFPDIVTTLIGEIRFDNHRDGILLCIRNDSEKFYSNEEIKTLEDNLKESYHVNHTDTTKEVILSEILDEPEKIIMQEIEEYSKYKVIITDRYHGTIFSLVAGTPVIILKTTDHKVTTGAEWFAGIYDDYVFLAENIVDAHNKVNEIVNKSYDYSLNPYFREKYYNKLKELFENVDDRSSFEYM